MTKLMIMLLAAAVLIAPMRMPTGDYNFTNRRALIVNSCPSIKLEKLSFYNQYESSARGTRFHQDLSWTNVGQEPIIAFEVVLLKYDAFDQRIIGTRWTVTGKNSADWSPLGPTESNADGTLGYGTEEVFTEIAYVRAARFASGTVWRVNEVELTASLQKIAPDMKEFGRLEPDPKPTESK